MSVQRLTAEELERQAYMKGDMVMSNLYDTLLDYEPTSEPSVDECLDELGAYGLRGDKLYTFVTNIKKDKWKIEDRIYEYEAVFDRILKLQGLPAVVEQLIKAAREM